MDYTKLKKPEHLKEKVWHQHLDWMDVMGKQLDENYARHLARIEEDASRREALLPLYEEAHRTPQVSQSLFNDPEH